jgi:putative transposase
MDAWQSALRFLWNLAHEQRLMGLARAEKRYPTAFDQINELTALRAELPWLADVPRNLCAQLLIELDKAWQRCFKRLGRQPRWKRKGRDMAALIAPQAFRIEGDALVFPKLGSVSARIHRPLEGKAKTCAIVREVDQWFCCVCCEVDVPEPIPRTEPIVGIDRGVTNLLADSDGALVSNPRFFQRAQQRLARAQRTVSRRKKGSKNREKAKTRVAELHRKVRRQRAHVLHELSARYAKNHGTVVVEKLNVKSMTRSAKGSVDAPGTNVRQKAGLNRSILDAGWGAFVGMLRYKLAWSGGRLVEVPAAYTSQRCSVCGHADASNRPSQAVFLCVSCGHSDHADTNAAKNIRAAESAVTVCGGAKSPLKQKLRIARCGQRSRCSGSSKAQAFRPG